jgi:hypothetical protein
MVYPELSFFADFTADCPERRPAELLDRNNEEEIT